MRDCRDSSRDRSESIDHALCGDEVRPGALGVKLRRPHPIAAARQFDDVRIDRRGWILDLDAGLLGQDTNVALESFESLNDLSIGQAFRQGERNICPSIAPVRAVPYVAHMGEIEVGDPAPDFTLDGTEGSFTLGDHRGERVVLLFYPGDDTTVCTKQFRAYRDGAAELAKRDAVFVGISTQGMDSKESFKAKYGLTTPLLADVDGAVSRAYGVYSRRFKVAKRAVFIVDEEGVIVHKHLNPMSLTFDNVDQLREALDSLPTRTN